MSVSKAPINPRVLAFHLALLIAMTPFALDTYLPAFPQMAADFGVSIQHMGYTLSTYLLGFSLGQLVGGPLSDRYGRRRVGAAGLLFFIVCTVQIIISDTFAEVVVWRLLQALGGGFSSVVVAAIVRDNYQGKDSARMFATMGMIVMVAPMLAPTVGALLLRLVNWQGIFAFLLVYALLLLVVLVTLVPASKTRNRDEPHLGRYFVSVYRQVVTETRGRPHLLSQALVSGVLFTFITNAAHIFIEYFKVSPEQFSVIFGTIVATNIALSRLNLRLLHRHSSFSILLLGSVGQLLGCLLLALYLALFTPSLAVVWLLLIIVVGTVGLIYGNNLSLYMENHPHMSGSANAVFGCSTFACGAITGSLSSSLPGHTLLPLSLIMLVCSLLGCLVLRRAQRDQ